MLLSNFKDWEIFFLFIITKLYRPRNKTNQPIKEIAAHSLILWKPRILIAETPHTTRVVRPNEVVVEGHVARQVASKEPFGLQFSEDGIKLGGP